LNKYIVPYFNYLWVIFVYKVPSGYFVSFFVASAIYMYFTARATGARFAHFPKIILFVAGQKSNHRYQLDLIED